MKTYALCPISIEKVNERVTRVNALVSLLLILTFMVTQNIFTIVFLAADYLLKTIGFAKFSSTAISSQSLLKWLMIKDTFINAGPKIFAARIGFILSSMTIISFCSLSTTFHLLWLASWDSSHF